MATEQQRDSNARATRQPSSAHLCVFSNLFKSKNAGKAAPRGWWRSTPGVHVVYHNFTSGKMETSPSTPASNTRSSRPTRSSPRTRSRKSTPSTVTSNRDSNKARLQASRKNSQISKKQAKGRSKGDSKSQKKKIGSFV